MNEINWEQQATILGSHYGSALLTIGALGNFILDADKKCWNTQFGACIYCARHHTMGHREDCTLVRAKRELLRMRDNPIIKALNVTL